MFDFKVIFYGLLAMSGVIATILMFSKKEKKPFPAWYDEVKMLFYKGGYSIHYVEQMSSRIWQEYYYDGLSPKEAYEDYFI